MVSKVTQSITTYLHSLKQTIDILASFISLISIEDMTDHVLHRLDYVYKASIDGINARDAPINFDDLLKKLLIQKILIVATQR